MSKRVPELYLFDIYVAILKIEQTSSKFDTPEELLHSYIHWDSVIREFEIIGEASRHLIQKELLSPEYRIVVDFRNKIIHEYFGIDEEEVWHIIQRDLPFFKGSILKIIEKIPEDLKTELITAFSEDNKYLSFVTENLAKINENIEP